MGEDTVRKRQGNHRVNIQCKLSQLLNQIFKVYIAVDLCHTVTYIHSCNVF